MKYSENSKKRLSHEIFDQFVRFRLKNLVITKKGLHQVMILKFLSWDQVLEIKTPKVYGELYRHMGGEYLNFRGNKGGHGQKKIEKHCNIVYLLFHYNSIVFSFFLNRAATLYLKKLAKKTFMHSHRRKKLYFFG